MMRTSPRFLLTIGDDGAFLLPEGADLQPLFAAAGDRHAEDRIMGLLARHAKAPLTLMADTLAQDIRQEVLPRLNWFDRRKLAARRLKLAFPHTRFAASLQ